MIALGRSHNWLAWWLFFSYGLNAQDSVPVLKQSESLSGYVRGIGSVQWNSLDNRWTSVNWLHLRVNWTKDLSDHVRIRSDVRTQIFYGDAVSVLPEYAADFRNEEEAIHAQTLWWKDPRTAAHTNVERLLAEYTSGDWSVIIGRQRIHWGMAVGWNPNDVFQVGNLFDPDYIERPGSDAIRVRRSLGALSGIEVATAWTGPESTRGALRYTFNRSEFDWQVIVGWMDRQPMLGAGWSGRLVNWGFRGEIQSYATVGNLPFQLQTVLELDRILSLSNYIHLSVLYNHQGTTIQRLFIQPIVPNIKQLMPGKWNGSVGWSREFSPRFNTGIELYYTSASSMFIVFPKAQWTFNRNWDLSVYTQYAVLGRTGQSTSRSMIRMGYSF